ncbi:MAG: helix-turn-helix domain-containing protein [Gemmatimonadetes bacterium]|nr:AraC family transcriptional regulator [Gemmatimonadota bacterium]NIR78088.1 AraC family transcriptional regulator [Gemmatimonadota bacterium]NIT86658.1 AraC family transcriptional regulator [Gemmatimonadota bacterium]NIU30508.1 AraC family transcriptional regulator [Gemmatimonadota bacterium]NIU35350.1 helix-turn-helix domain-containing protein [Gemmatimonadota bacterium]
MDTIHRLGGYREYRPPPDLRDVVQVVWVYARSPGGDPGSPDPRHRVLPDPGVSVAFQCLRDRDGGVSNPRVVLHGPVMTPRLFRPRPGLHLEGVRLKPEWCPDLLDLEPRDHADADRDLREVAPGKARALPHRLEDTRHSREAIGILLDEVRRLLAGARPSRATLLAHAGLEGIRGPHLRSLNLSGLAGELGVSPRHLRRVIRERTGMGPKRLQRILRLGGAVVEADRLPRPSWARLAVASGFYDQAHLIQEFRDLTDRTPTRLHAERRTQSAPAAAS